MSSSGTSITDTRTLPDANIVVLATFAAEPIEESLSFWMEQAQLPGQIRFAPYNQVVQQLRAPASFAVTNGGVNVLLLRLEDWADGSHDRDALAQQVGAFVQALTAIGGSMSATYLIGICPPSTDATEDAPFNLALEQQQDLLASQLAPISAVELLDLSAAITRYQVDEWYDPLADELGHMPYTFEFFAAMGTTIAQKLFAVFQLPWSSEFQTGEQIMSAVRTRQRTQQLPENTFVAPRNEVEQALATILAEVLSVDQVGVYDNFFELGGDSVLAIEIISRVHTLFQIETPLMTVFFETPTVAGIAEAIAEDLGDAETTARGAQGVL
jgi:acyl carrier protein